MNYTELQRAVASAMNECERVGRVELTQESYEELANDARFSEAVSGSTDNATFIETIAGYDIYVSDRDVVLGVTYDEKTKQYDID